MWLIDGLFVVWLALLAGGVVVAWRFQRGLGNRIELAREPAVVVIAPVKGTSRHLPTFVARLRAQRYGRYRIVAVVEAETDPAVPVLRAAAEGPGAPLTIAVAGLSVDEGQKVHNLIHALDRLESGDEMVAFVDADTQPAPDWLVRLVEPLTRGGIDVVTGHRWLIPVNGDVPSAVTAAATNSLVAALRIWDVVWGGTCAMRRETVERIGLRERWRGAIVDDVFLTRIVHEHRLRLLAPRSLIVPSPVEHSARSALAFGRRQYKFVGWYLPKIWWSAVAATTFHLVAGACALVLALRGDLFAILALVVAVALAQARAEVRLMIVRKTFDVEAQRAYRAKADYAVRWLPPLWIGLHVVSGWSTLLSRRLVWAGVVYEFRGHRETRIVSRPAA
ncbi:glycosyltransferase family 2 protein [Methylobacterium sp. NEAU 140]|uniref:glycosyltransferase n=1 Tax=Methylobacterium sp. NEAU 140 TaxID=3064945 RepID=UPI002733A5ED|nr:glycosyltransferase family 2 protein [Methylobacterium sp. NEAU 140]MDP4023143.1 glycosyltransferase family 2 protein [Methylobacterium sp. NEAU 140]